MKCNLGISLRPDPFGNWPKVDPTAYIDPTAQIIGAVHIGPTVFVGPGAVVRADEADAQGKVSPVHVGPECNIQDGVIIHALGGTGVTIGRRTSLGHGCIVHGPCTLGKGCFIGFGAHLFDATLGDGVYISMAAVVQGVELAEKSLVPASVAILSRDHVLRFVGTTSPTERMFMEKVVASNLTLVQGYNRLDRSRRKCVQER
jgi:carbonic anhydrase/acetyltransferase-like protein (isoleucine patch superfamily)